jgi:hypothetical protein
MMFLVFVVASRAAHKNSPPTSCKKHTHSILTTMRKNRSIQYLLTTLLVTGVVNGQISRQDCIDLGGQVIGDIGDGSIFLPTYVCESNGLAPIDVVIAGPEEPVATDGEVCCGPAGDGSGNNTHKNTTLSEDECASLDGVVVENDPLECLDQQPPLGTITTSSARQQRALCCPSTISRLEFTRQECLDNNGTIVGDIGDGAIFQEDYLCESNGMPPIANILQDTPPFAIEGEVCCGVEEDDEFAEIRDEATRQECIEEGGVVVGDIGDGATRRDDYLCESNGEPPIANIVPAEGEPIAREGEVCCGNITYSSTTALTQAPTRENIMPEDSAPCYRAFSFALSSVIGFFWIAMVM